MREINKNKLFLCVLLFLTFQLIAQSNKGLKGYPIQEYLGQTNISEIALAPNGNYLAIVTMQNNFETNVEEYSLWRFTLDENGIPSNKIKLSATVENKYNLKWSYDSNYLFFISKNKKGRNLFKINMNGGEAFATIKDQKIANKMASYEFYKENKVLLNINNTKKKHDKNELYNDVLYWSGKNNTYISTFYTLNYSSNAIDSIFTIKHPIAYFQVSPNKQKIAFSSNDISDYIKFKNTNRFHSYIFDIESKKIEKQLTFDGGYEYPKWASNSRLVFNNFGDPKEKEYNYIQGKLYGYAIEESSYLPLNNEFKGAVNDFEILDKDHILFTATESTKLNLYESKKGKTKQLTFFEGKITGFTFSKTKDVYVFSAVTKNSFPEIYVSKGLNKKVKPKKISDFNKRLNSYPKPKIETVTWKNAANELVEGVLIWPPNTSKKDKLPLVVDIHGGPWSARYEAITLDGIQYYYYGSLLASKGFLVLQPNYTGGIGRGNKFLKKILKSPIKKPALDIINGVESLLEKGWVDKNNMVVMGASYGGLLTNAIITETNMFQLAMTSCGNWNELADYGSSDGDILQGYLFKDKKIWSDYQYYWEESPIAKVENITTPILITHGEKDIRVPTIHAKSMYRALEYIGKTDVELVLFPKEGHIYKQPKNKLKKVQIELEWIDKYIDY